MEQQRQSDAPYAPQAQPYAAQYNPNGVGLGQAPVHVPKQVPVPKLPNEGHYYLIFCLAYCFCGWFPLIPAGVSFYLRDQSIKMAAMGNSALAGDKAKQAKTWLCITYCIMALGMALLILLIVLWATGSYSVYTVR